MPKFTRRISSVWPDDTALDIEVGQGSDPDDEDRLVLVHYSGQAIELEHDEARKLAQHLEDAANVAETENAERARKKQELMAHSSEAVFSVNYLGAEIQFSVNGKNQVVVDINTADLLSRYTGECDIPKLRIMVNEMTIDMGEEPGVVRIDGKDVRKHKEL